MIRVLPAAIVVSLFRADPLPPDADPFAPCEELMQKAPGDVPSAACFYAVATRTGLREEAVRRVDAWRERDPDGPALLLARANLESDLEGSRTEELYLRAIDRFRAVGPPKGVMFASINLSNYYSRHGRVDDAGRLLAQAGQVAASAGDREMILATRTLTARHLWQEGIDLGRAYRTIKSIEAEVLAGPRAVSKIQLLHTLGGISSHLGRTDEAFDAYRRLAELTAAEKDDRIRSTALARMAITRMNAIQDAPRDARADEVLALAREALELAIRSGNRSAEALALELIAALAPAEDAPAKLARCAAITSELGDPYQTSICLLHRGRLEARTDAAQGFETIDEAVELARGSGAPSTIANALATRASIRWRHGTREQALADTREALDAIEAIRDLQRDDRVRTILFGEWSRSYLEASGLLLAAGDLEPAFAITERLRARTLLEDLDRAAATRTIAGGNALGDRRNEVLDRIAKIQRQLLDPALAAEPRKRLLEELARAEADEATLREDLAAADPEFAALRRPTYATLAAVQGALAPDEALLSFQLSSDRDINGDPLGGSWAVVVTREGAAAHRLEARADLAASIDAFVGLLARRDGGERDAAAALHRALLAPALGDRPPPRRLVIVPDGPLYRLPFALLRAAPDRPALAESTRISFVPSATVWLRLHAQAPAPATHALVLADPELAAGAAEDPSEERGWALSLGARFGPLPHARHEAAVVAGAVGPGSRVLVGPEAAERSLKTMDLSGYRVVHFAAHAVVDEEQPDRSAVVLSPGAAEEDGLLQIRDVVGLDLAGRVVVLSACRSAQGRVVRGEGVVGLTHAFLQAGASAVVGSLWPLRDDDAAALVSDLYLHLSRGETLDEAVAAAQRAAIRRGAPPEAWAGIVVVGNGAVIPVAARPVPAGRALLVAGAALLGALLVLVAGRARR